MPLLSTVSRVIVLSLLFALGTLVFGQTGAVVPPPMPGRLVDVSGRRVHIYCEGQGKQTVVVASGGFSIDWGLVQPEIARLMRICTYDPAGMAWSDPDPDRTTPYCTGRVTELHQLLISASVPGPYILVGYSIGGLVARLYVAQYPSEVSGVVFVDHAFLDTPGDSEQKSPAPSFNNLDSPPVLISESPINLDMADDRNFAKLPERDQQLHKWAISHSSKPTPEMAAECFSEVENAEKNIPFPFGDKPEAVISTLYDSPRYKELQRKLLMLSKNSKQFVAENSSHMVVIDQPEIVVKAIREVISQSSR